MCLQAECQVRPLTHLQQHCRCETADQAIIHRVLSSSFRRRQRSLVDLPDTACQGRFCRQA